MEMLPHGERKISRYDVGSRVNFLFELSRYLSHDIREKVAEEKMGFPDIDLR